MTKSPWPFRKKTILIFAILLVVFGILGCVTSYLDYQNALSRMQHYPTFAQHPLDWKSIYGSLWMAPLCVVLAYAIAVLIWLVLPILKEYDKFWDRFDEGMK
jgi:ABC-type spermidine/putrescine transport system permease subunit I